MGQAKLRGSLDERIAQAIVKAEADREAAALTKAAAEQEKAARVASMPPAERKRFVQRERGRRMAGVNLVGLMLALAAVNTDPRPSDE